MLHYIVWTLAAILYSPIFYQLYRARWDTIDYTHAYFILPISLWLAWRKRALLIELTQKIKPANNLLNFSLFLLGISMLVFGRRQDYLFISTLSLLPLLYGLIGYLYGKGVVKSLSFPLLYLLLLIPPPVGVLDNITLPMRHGVSIATEVILKLLNYPISREGLLLSIGEYKIFMAQPCSGFRSLITMLSLALVYVYLIKGSLTKKLILILSIIPFALFGNLIRVIALSLITYYFGVAAGEGFFHNFSGIAIFSITILGLIGLELLLNRLLPGQKTDKQDAQ